MISGRERTNVPARLRARRGERRGARRGGPRPSNGTGAGGVCAVARSTSAGAKHTASSSFRQLPSPRTEARAVPSSLWSVGRQKNPGFALWQTRGRGRARCGGCRCFQHSGQESRRQALSRVPRARCPSPGAPDDGSIKDRERKGAGSSVRARGAKGREQLRKTRSLANRRSTFARGPFEPIVIEVRKGLASARAGGFTEARFCCIACNARPNTLIAPEREGGSQSFPSRRRGASPIMTGSMQCGPLHPSSRSMPNTCRKHCEMGASFSCYPVLHQATL